jgi:hypothetical protein
VRCWREARKTPYVLDLNILQALDNPHKIQLWVELVVSQFSPARHLRNNSSTF